MSLAGVRVLVVEDDPDGREVTRKMLVALGARVTVAANGAEALRKLAVAVPDLVLCDLLMPVMDGFRLAQRVRGDPRHRGVRLVALTVLRHDEAYLGTWSAGFDGHLTKPVTFEMLDGLERFVPRRREACGRAGREPATGRRGRRRQGRRRQGWSRPGSGRGRRS